MSNQTDSLVLEIKVDAKTGLPILTGVRKEAEKTADAMDGIGKKSEKTTNQLGGMWKQMLAGQAAFLALYASIYKVADLIGDFARAAIDAEETYSKFGTVFRDVSVTANAQLKELAANYGLSQRAAAVMLGDTGDLLTGLGMTGKAALDLSLQTQKLAVDLASFTNYSGGAEGASQALTKAMLGEREMLKSLGIAISEEMVQAELAARGQKDLEGTALMAAKAQATLTLAMRQSPNAIGDYSRTMDSAANVTRRIAAAWDDVKVEVGGAIMKEIKPMMLQALEWIQNNKDAIIDFGTSAAAVLGDIVVALKGLVDTLVFVGDKIIWVADKMKFLNPSGFMQDLAAQQAKAFSSWKMVTDEVKAANQKIIDAVAEAQKKSLADAKSEEQDFWADIRAMGERLKKEKQENIEAVSKAQKAAYDQELKDIDSLTKSFYGIKETLVEQVELHIKSAEALGITGDAAQRLRDMLSDARFRQTLEQMPEAAKDTAEQLYDMVPPLQRSYDVAEQLKNPMGDVVKRSEQTRKEWQAIARGIGDASDLLGGMGNLFDSLGMGGMGNFLNQLGGIAGGVSSTVASFASGDIVGGIVNGLNSLSSVIDFAGNLFGWNGNGVDDWVKDFDRMGVAISENIIEQIKKAKEAGEDAGAAQARFTAEIIQQGELTKGNMAGYRRLLNDIMMQYDVGHLSMTEATNELGEAWVALAEKAKEAGMAGARDLVESLNDARNRGMVSDDMQAWIDQARKAGTDALAAHITGISTSQEGFNRAMRDTMAMLEGMKLDGKSSSEIIDALGASITALQAAAESGGYTGMDGYLSELLGMQKFVEKNGPVLDAMAASKAYMESMANQGLMTADRFADAQATMQSYFDQYIKSGSGEEKALESILPMLKEQLYWAEQYGYVIDDQTRALIEKAQAHGMDVEGAASYEQMQLDYAKQNLEMTGRMVDALEMMAGKYEAINRQVDVGATGMERYRFNVISAANALNGFNFAGGGAGKSADIGAYASGTDWKLLRDMESAWISGERGPELNLLDKRSGKIKIIPQGGNSVTGSVSGGSQVIKETKVNKMEVTLSFPNVTNVDPVNAILTAYEHNTGNIIGKTKRFIKV